MTGPADTGAVDAQRPAGRTARPMRAMSASSTGPPTTSAMKTVRRDHSISPSDRSKMRRRPTRGTGPGGWRCVGGWIHGVVIESAAGLEVRPAQWHYFTRYWKTACRLSSGDVTSSIAAELARWRPARSAARRTRRACAVCTTTAPSSNRRLSTSSSARNSRASARGSRGADVDGVRMLVDQVADLVDVALGEDPAVVDQQDVRRHRLDLVQDVARDDDALAGAAPSP